MDILSFKDRRLRRLVTDGDVRGLPPAVVTKIGHMITFLSVIGSETELATLKAWRAHRLSGELAGYWSLTVTKNWRLIFKIEDEHIIDLDLIDYH